MKKLVAVIFFIGITWIAGAQTDTLKTDALLLKESEHDFGMIPQGKPVTYFFGIVNTGTTPLKLDNVQASCGCTTPEWSHEPIAPGATAKIKVGYNAAGEGYFLRQPHFTMSCLNVLAWGRKPIWSAQSAA